MNVIEPTTVIPMTQLGSPALGLAGLSQNPHPSNTRYGASGWALGEQPDGICVRMGRKASPTSLEMTHSSNSYWKELFAALLLSLQPDRLGGAA